MKKLKGVILFLWGCLIWYITLGIGIKLHLKYHNKIGGWLVDQYGLMRNPEWSIK